MILWKQTEAILLCLLADESCSLQLHADSSKQMDLFSAPPSSVCNDSRQSSQLFHNVWLNETNGTLNQPPSCVDGYSTAVNISSCCSMVSSNCSQFCREFSALPYIYQGVSVVSAVCCCLVFLTYWCLPRLRQTGYSSKVFLNRSVDQMLKWSGHPRLYYSGTSK